MDALITCIYEIIIVVIHEYNSTDGTLIKQLYFDLKYTMRVSPKRTCILYIIY